MSDLDQIDRAFDALTRDLSRTSGPGAAAAVATARKRRRTRVGAVALATLVVVGGGLTVPRLVFPEDGVAANGGSDRFDTAALGRATEGWIGQWETWERYSPWGGGGFGVASCSSIGNPDAAPVPQSDSSGVSRFVSHSGASSILLMDRYADSETASSAEALSLPAPDTCGTTTTYDVDGVQVRHDSMPSERAPGEVGNWLGDIWSVRIGDQRARLEVATDTEVADPSTAEEVAEALVAGLRDGWTQSGMEAVTMAPEGKGQLPEFPEVDLEGALAGWQSSETGSASAWPNMPCLDEMFTGGSASTTAGGTPRGVTWRIAGFDDGTTAPAKVESMLEEIRTCRTGGMQVETLPNGIHVATYDIGGVDGRGALWFGATGDRAGLIGVDGADRPMPMGVRENVADALYSVLRLPWD